MKDLNVSIWVNEQIPRKEDSRTPPPRHIIKLSKNKDKERILKTAKEKQLITYKQSEIF
jgi:hypothetical protein